MQRLALLFATCGHLGFVPIAPGTFGSAAGLVVLAGVRATGSTLVEIVVIAGLLGIGVWSAGVVERHLGMVDPGPVVVDEVIGMLMTVAFIPLNGAGLVVAFVLFRALDIIKPWPVSRFERLPGGVGIVADDAMSAVYGNLLMRGLIAVTPGWLV